MTIETVEAMLDDVVKDLQGILTDVAVIKTSVAALGTQNPPPPPPPTTNTPTFESSIAYTKTRPAFTPKRTFDVATASDFKTRLSTMQAGDLIRATAPFVVNGETIIKSRPSGPVVLDLGDKVTFRNAQAQNLPAVFMVNPCNLRIYGGNITTDGLGGAGLVIHGMQKCQWWGFKIHDVGGSGLYAATIGYPFEDNDFFGEIRNPGKNPSYDPHAEKGTGFHGALLWDSGTANQDFARNRFAFDMYDIPVGAGVSYGTPSSCTAPGLGNSIILRATRLTKVALSQVAGNALQFWGNRSYAVRIPYLEARDCQGRAFDANGMQGTQLAGTIVEYGRGYNCCLNQKKNEPIPQNMYWDTRGGAKFQDVAPRP